jgi:hypothetical protein
MKQTLSTRKIPRRLATVFFAILLAGPTIASAAECPESSPEDPQERRRLAKEWFSTAETAENIGDDVEATRAYACSYKMVAHPFTAFNLGRVAERAGDLDLSLKMYKAYLALKPDAKDREDVKLKVSALEDKIAGKETSTETETATTTPPIEETTEETAVNEPPPDVLTPPPEPKPADVVRRPVEPTPEPEPRSHLVEWLVGGGAGAALIAGIATNLIARAKMDTCRADAKNGMYKTANDHCNEARPMAYTSYAMFSIAAAAVAADTVLILMRRGSEGGSSSDTYEDEEASLDVMLLPGGAGIAARGRF